ncbi:MAG: hypothetical protein HY739_00465 [Desulfobacterales bacterium]|nr:hypothetical protein [Desulfobacterales bacterium]
MDIFIWPLVVIVISFIAMIIFRSALSRLIDRVSKASKNGISFDRGQERGIPETPPLSFDDLMKLPITASILDREKYLKTYIETLKLKSDSEKTDVLIRFLSFSRLEVEFNNISYHIFGSQVGLLNHLSGNLYGLTLAQIEPIYNLAKETYPSSYEDRTLNDWLNYLITNNLIIQNNDRIIITQYGKDFLKHLIDTNQVYERYG